ncbi:MAG: lipopolysaccharide biosynthesis protein [endosymbiont of Galathealinum brachiosum]|uniref:Lipopolysaccharide biosynthesis protein n=1 Tax=endosymbiont of Galathealinum brachiosum TaxID=2200906 RepID=A0A370DHC6_9GAMM|nr:MAG: lipopolysaccharide biosynthesis protein [endosymbiont of Galathealinum brachiosum]
MLNVVIPMAGAGSRFSNAGYTKSKPFIDVNGAPMIARVLENLTFHDARYILIARKKDIENESLLINSIKKKFNVIFVAIDNLTEGTASTVLFSRKYINNKEPLLIANSDQIIELDIKNFIDDCFNRKLDGSILTFIDELKDPKWSFARINENKLVVEVREKKAISKYATVGIYLFSKGKYFVDNAIDMIINNDRVNNEFYTCPVYNYCIENNLKIGIYNIKQTQMHGIGTPDDLNKYLKHIET